MPPALTKVEPGGNVSVTVIVVATLGPEFVTETVYVSIPPAFGDIGSRVITMPRSADAPTLETTFAVLFAVTGSPVIEETLTVSVASPPAAGASATIVIAGAAPVGSAAAVHVTTSAAWVHVQPVPIALTNVAPGGNVSVTVTVDAEDGPLFVTSTVYVIGAPAVTGSGAAVIATARSALSLTFVITEPALLVVFGSGVVLATVTGFVIVPGVAGAVAMIVIAGAAPVGKLGALQVTT